MGNWLSQKVPINVLLLGQVQHSGVFNGSFFYEQLAGLSLQYARKHSTIAYGYLDAYFDTINVKLTTYENLWNEAPMLVQEQFRIDDSLVVMKILSFL